jgi:hypothetical protein
MRLVRMTALLQPVGNLPSGRDGLIMNVTHGLPLQSVIRPGAPSILIEVNAPAAPPA